MAVEVYNGYLTKNFSYPEMIKSSTADRLGISNPNLAKWISENLVFDQLILEFYDGKDPNSGWVHCSYKKDDTNRGAMLTALRVNGKTQYKKGLLP